MQAAAHPERRIGRLTGLLVETLVALALTALLLAAAEWVAGRYLEHRLEAVQAAHVAHVDLAQKDFVTGVLAWMDLNPVPLVADPELLWRNRPGSEKTQPVNPEVLDRPLRWTATIDARGYRDGPQRLAPDHPGVYRILCVGDSITYGFNVDAADTFPRQLQALLERRHPGRRFEVINTGVAGWSWVQGRRWLQLEGLALRPDAVVIGHGTNDQFFPATITDAERIGSSTSAASRLARRLASRLAETNLYRMARVLAPPSGEPSPGCAAQPPAACRRVGIPEIAATIGEIRALTRAAGAELVLMNADFMETPAVEGLRRAALPFLDFVARFAAQRAEIEAEHARKRELAPAAALTPATPVARDSVRSVVLRVADAPPARALRVAGAGYFQDAFRFDEPAFDDGSHGDERPGDGVFTATVAVPAGIHALEYRFVADGRPEFQGLPPLPSTQGSRLLRVGDGARGPIERFGEIPFMAERTHPNAEGQALIAAALADELATRPSFARWVGAASQAGGDASRR